MGYGIDDGSKYYAFDGMHCNYNNIMTDAEEQSEEATVEQGKVTLNKLKKNFLASLLTFQSNLSIRNHLVKKILVNEEKYMIRRYAQKESLPQKYSLVAEFIPEALKGLGFNPEYFDPKSNFRLY